MKKLMILASAAALACVANAGSCVWGFTGYDYLGPNGEGWNSDYEMNLFSGGKAFLYYGTVTATESAFNIGTAKFIDSALYDEEGLTYGNQDSNNRSVSAYLPDDVPAGEAYTLIMVDSDVSTLDGYEGKYVIYNGTGDAIKDPVTEKKFGDFSYAGAVGGEGLAWQTMSNVPEPTSGLLLLLGVAGLALRRRRA